MCAEAWAHPIACWMQAVLAWPYALIRGRVVVERHVSWLLPADSYFSFWHKLTHIIFPLHLHPLSSTWWLNSRVLCSRLSTSAQVYLGDMVGLAPDYYNKARIAVRNQHLFAAGGSCLPFWKKKKKRQHLWSTVMKSAMKQGMHAPRNIGSYGCLFVFHFHYFIAFGSVAVFQTLTYFLIVICEVGVILTL